MVGSSVYSFIILSYKDKIKVKQSIVKIIHAFFFNKKMFNKLDIPKYNFQRFIEIVFFFITLKFHLYLRYLSRLKLYGKIIPNWFVTFLRKAPFLYLFLGPQSLLCIEYVQFVRAVQATYITNYRRDIGTACRDIVATKGCIFHGINKCAESFYNKRKHREDIWTYLWRYPNRFVKPIRRPVWLTGLVNHNLA